MISIHEDMQKEPNLPFTFLPSPITLDGCSSLCNFLLPPPSTQLLPSTASDHVLPSVLQTNIKVTHTHTHCTSCDILKGNAHSYTYEI